MSKNLYVSLDTLAQGAAGDLFERELRKVLANIQDPNTSAKAKRSITLKLVIEPSEDRETAAYTVDCVAKIAPARPHLSRLYFGEDGDRLVAVAHDFRQRELFPNAEAADDAVTPISTRSPKEA